MKERKQALESLLKALAMMPEEEPKHDSVDGKVAAINQAGLKEEPEKPEGVGTGALGDKAEDMVKEPEPIKKEPNLLDKYQNEDLSVDELKKVKKMLSDKGLL